MLICAAWRIILQKTRELLQAYATSADVADFDTKTALQSMFMLDRKLAEVREFCNKNPNWMEDLMLMKFTILNVQAERIFL